jgi:hypothetical protein
MFVGGGNWGSFDNPKSIALERLHVRSHSLFENPSSGR